VAALVTIWSAGSALAQDLWDSSAGQIRVERMIGNLERPWALGFLPDGGYLITEIEGRILLVSGGQARALSGVPDVAVMGQGGLLDLVVARDFAQSGEIFLSYAKPDARGAKTALAVARLDRDAAALRDLRVIFEMSAASPESRHFGSRIVEAPDGTLFLTIGDRGARELAQNPRVHNGKVVRVNRDGSIPADNPRINGGALPGIWSVGHRNAQGATLDETGRFWTVSHGAQGGDEINTPEAGLNYGWPIITYGIDYNGHPIGRGQRLPGMEQPRHYWDPSIAPSGMMIYSGRLFPEWRGDIFVGSLKWHMISRLERDGDSVTEAERLFDRSDFYRVRDVREAPDGSIWFLSEGQGAAYRITPAG